MRSHRVWIAALLVFACGESSGPEQTIHDAPITKDQTWSRADSPPIVRGTLTILGGATLTIGAGATVLFDSEAGLILRGQLLALGSVTAPITMRSLQETSGWNQAWDVPNLFVTDGAAMTSSGNQNPSLTYMALTARACHYALEQLKRGDL